MNTDYSGIIHTMDRFSNHYRRGNLPDVLALFCRTVDPTIVWSTDQHVCLIGLKEITEHFTCHFQQPSIVLKRARWTNLNCIEDVAWITSLPDIVLPGNKAALPGRFTAILLKEDARWQIAHLHLFFPQPPNLPPQASLVPSSD